MKEQEIEKIRDIIVKSWSGRIRDNAEALYDAGYRNVNDMKLISDKEIKDIAVEAGLIDVPENAEVEQSDIDAFKPFAQAQLNTDRKGVPNRMMPRGGICRRNDVHSGCSIC